MKTIGSFCALAVLGFGAAAHAGTYDHILRQYPASSGDCHAVARDLGGRLTELSGMPLTRASCVDIGADGYELRFEYTADDELPLVTTVDRYAGPDAQGGFYATIEDCQAALPGETERFESATGLRAFVAYCQKDALAVNPYAIHVEGFGDPAVRPRVESVDTNGDLVGVTTAQLEAQLQSRLAQSELNLSYVKYRSFGGFGVLAFLYYDAERIPAVVRYPVRTQTAGECLATLESLRPVYDAQTPAPLASFCVFRDGYRAYDVVTVSLGSEVLPTFTSAERFVNRAACEGARAGLVAKYGRQTGRSIAASACTYDYQTTQWRVAMLEIP